MKEKIIVPIFNSVDFNRVTEEILDEFYDARLIISKSDMQVLIPASIYDGESVSDSHFYLITKQNSITNYINIPGLGITFIIINMNIFEPTYYSFDKNLIEFPGFGEDDCIVKLRLFSSDNELIFSPDEWYEKFNRILITSHYYSEEELTLIKGLVRIINDKDINDIFCRLPSGSDSYLDELTNYYQLLR